MQEFAGEASFQSLHGERSGADGGAGSLLRFPQNAEGQSVLAAPSGHADGRINVAILLSAACGFGGGYSFWCG